MASIEGLLQNMYPPVSAGWRRSQSLITDPSPHSLTPEKNNEKILEVTNRIIELLMGEERKYRDDHTHVYKNTMMENQPHITSPHLFEGAKTYQRGSAMKEEIEDENLLDRGNNTEIDYTITTIKEESVSREESHLDGPCWARTIQNPSPSAKIQEDSIQSLYISNHEGTTWLSDVPRDSGAVETDYSSFHFKEESFTKDEGCFLEQSMQMDSSFLQVGDKTTEERSGRMIQPVIPSQTPSQSLETMTYSCDECKKIFSGSSDFLKHQLMYNGPHSLACLECGKFFDKKEQLVKHQQLHKKPKLYTCPVCNKSFSLNSVLLMHQRIHTGEKPFPCKDCGKCFAQKSTLVKHFKSHSGERPYSCSTCGKSFSSRPGLILHQQTHTGEKPFVCSECGNCFAQKIGLVKHQRVHTGEKPFSCAECGKCFTQKHSLVIHQRTHSGEKPYGCPDCGRCFSRSALLTTHQRIHSGEKPYSCLECGKSFRHNSSFIIHQRSHTGERPYSCSVCGKCYTRSSHLILHQRVHLA